MFRCANRMEFWHSCWVFFAGNLKVFDLTPKFIINTSLFEKTFFFQNDPQRTRKTVPINPPKMSAKSRKLTKWVIEHQVTWQILFPWICNFLFRERSEKFFGHYPSVFLSMSEGAMKNVFFSALFFSKCSFELIEQELGILANFLAENLKRFCSNSEIL